MNVKDNRGKTSQTRFGLFRMAVDRQSIVQVARTRFGLISCGDEHDVKANQMKKWARERKRERDEEVSGEMKAKWATERMRFDERSDC